MWTQLKGDVWYADLGKAFGSEQGGVRPVVIISGNRWNASSTMRTVIPLTSKPKNNQSTHAPISADWLPERSVALAEQIRSITYTRFKEYIGTISNEQISAIEKVLFISLDI